MEHYRGNKCLSTIIGRKEIKVLADGLMTELLETQFCQLQRWCAWAAVASPGVAEVDGAWLIVKVTQATHEGVSEAAEMVDIYYFSGEKITHIVVSGDV